MGGRTAADGERGRMKVRRGMGSGSYSTTGATQSATAGLGCFDVPMALLEWGGRAYEARRKSLGQSGWEPCQIGRPVVPEAVCIPIREGVIISVQIPLDMTEPEAEKVARVVAALASK